MIERGLTKLEDLEMFIARLDIKRELSRRVPVEASHLLDDDWLVLSETADILKSLKDLTIWLQGGAEDVTHGSVLETLPAIELLLEHLEHQKVVYQDYTEPCNTEQAKEGPFHQQATDELSPAHSTRR